MEKISMAPGGGPLPTPPAVRVTCDLAGFLADWRRCDQFSNYLAESLSLAKADPFAFSSLLSTIINEVLETIFCHNAGQGVLSLQLFEEADASTVLRAEFAVNEQIRTLYEGTVASLSGQDPVQLYEQLLFQSASADTRELCLYEIAADYGARLSLGESGRSGVLCLEVRLGLNEWLKNRVQE